MGEITMNRDYTGKYAVGQTVYINDTRSYLHGRQFTIQAIDDSPKKAYAYQVDGLWYPEAELSAEPTVKPPTKPQPSRTWETMDIDSGLGIGGINNDQTMPFVPSIAAIERVQRMHDTDTVCRRCGASANFDGAMFTNLGGINICDDCA